MKLRSLLILPILAALYFARIFTFCSTTQNCPAYNDTAWNKWIPYSPGQQLVFWDGGAGRDTLNIASVTKSEATNKKVSGEKYYSCSSNADARSAEDAPNGRPALWITSERGDYASFTLELHQFSITTTDLNDSGLVPRTLTRYQFERLYNYRLGSRVYPVVQAISVTDTLPNRPNKVYLAPGVGIAGYELYPTQQLWTLR